VERDDIEKVKERIANLLAMSKDQSSPHEAAIAASRARKLMDKYQLSEADMADAKADVFGRVQAGHWYKSIPKHTSQLAVAVAKYNDCQARVTGKYRRGSWQKRIEFLGYSNDAQLAVQMFDFLLEACRVERIAYMAVVGLNAGTVGEKFNLGFCHQVVDRLDAMTKERELITSETGKSMGALVVIKQKAVEQEFGAANYKKTRSTQLTTHDAAEAYCAGQIKGSIVEITKAID
jgi:hypothetical protein